MTRCPLFQFSKYGKPTISSSFGFCLTNWFFHRSLRVSLRSNGFPEKNRQVLLLLMSQVGRPSCHPTNNLQVPEESHSLTTIITIIFFCSLIVRNAEASMVEIESCDRPYKRTSASATHPRVQYECKQCIFSLLLHRRHRQTINRYPTCIWQHLLHFSIILLVEDFRYYR